VSEDLSSDTAPRSFDDVLEVIYIGAVPAAAVLAFVTQPLLHLVDPDWLFYAGLWVAGAVAMLMAARRFRPDRSRRQVFWLYMLVPLIALIVIAANALERANWNDLRCARIETAMLHPDPNTRDDLPDVFQALGCRPQHVTPPGARNRPKELARALDAEVVLSKPAIR
jgi:hypothetical protein